MFRPTALILALLALAPPARAAALFHLTDLGTRKWATLNNRGDVGFSLSTTARQEFGIYRSLDPAGAESRFVLAGESSPFRYWARPLIGQDGALYGTRSEPARVGRSDVAYRVDADGSVTVLASAGTGSSYVAGVTPDGRVVGYSYTGPPGALPRVFVHDPAAPTSPARTADLGQFGGSAAYPIDVNAAGQFLTDVLATNGVLGQVPALVDPDGSLVRLTPPAGVERAGLAALNDRGQAVGFATTADPATSGAYLVDQGVWTPIRLPGRPDVRVSNATDINNRGDLIVETSLGQRVIFGSRGYALDELFDDPSGRWVELRATAINDLGQILARGSYLGADTGGWQDRTLLLTPATMAKPVPPPPVPEPTALASLLALAALLARRRLRD